VGSQVRRRPVQVNKFAAVLVGTLILVVGVLIGTGYIGFYNGLNKGITVGNCGIEVVGEPGWFCGDY
jgi:hypothetical protein